MTALCIRPDGTDYIGIRVEYHNVPSELKSKYVGVMPRGGSETPFEYSSIIPARGSAIQTLPVSDILMSDIPAGTSRHMKPSRLRRVKP